MCTFFGLVWCGFIALIAPLPENYKLWCSECSTSVQRPQKIPDRLTPPVLPSPADSPLGESKLT